MLTLWKLHSENCKETNAKEFAKLAKKDHRFFKKCRCACWMTGVHPITKKYIKKSLNVSSWEVGDKLMAEFAGNKPSRLEGQKITLKEAFKQWVADKARVGVGESTRDTTYNSLEVCVMEFADSEGLTLLSQLDDDACFRLIVSPRWASWARSTANRQLSCLRSFFQFAQKRKWIESDPTIAIDRAPNKRTMFAPYTKEEEAKLEEAFGSWTEDLERCSGQWSSRPKTLHCLKHVLEDTGLRISDAQRFRPELIQVLPNGDGEWTLKQNKLDGEFYSDDHAEVVVYLKRSTLEEVARVPWCSERYPFITQPRREHDRESFKRHLRREGIRVWTAMQHIGEIAGVANCRPHRFRHTFAHKMYLKGYELEKIARFLGHKSTKMLEDHYGKWTKEKQAILRDKRIEQFEEERRRNAGVIEMPKAG